MTLSSGGEPVQAELFDDVPCEPTCDLSAGRLVSVVLNQEVTSIDLHLAACPARSFQDVEGTTLLGEETMEACERVSAGAGTRVGSGADVTFRSGGSIVLRDGFSVASGSRFRAIVETAWSDDAPP